MGSPLRSRLDMDSRRAQLLELGLRLFGTRAYDDVSIDDIAREANVSKGLLYHYFGGKRAFYVAVVRDGARRLLEAIEPDPSLTPPQRAFAGLDAYLCFVQECGDAYAALVTGGLGADPEISAILEGAREQQVRSMLTDLGLSQPRPVYRLAVRAWIGGVEIACADWLREATVSRAALIQVLLLSLKGAIAAAYAVDPVDSLAVAVPRLIEPPEPTG